MIEPSNADIFESPESVQNYIKDALDEITRLTRELEEAKRTITELSFDGALNRANTEIDYQKNQIETLELQKQELVSNVTDLRAKLQDEIFHVQHLKTKLEAVEKERGAYQLVAELKSVEHDQCHESADKGWARVEQLEAENAALREANSNLSASIGRDKVELVSINAKLQADLAASQKEVERLKGYASFRDNDNDQLKRDLAKSEASRGRFVEALEKMGCSCCDGYMPHDQDFENCSKNLAEKLIKSEPRSSVYDAIKEIMAASKSVWDESREETNKAVSQVIYWKKLERLGKSLTSLTAVLGPIDAKS